MEKGPLTLVYPGNHVADDLGCNKWLQLWDMCSSQEWMRTLESFRNCRPTHTSNNKYVKYIKGRNFCLAFSNKNEMQ